MPCRVVNVPHFGVALHRLETFKNNQHIYQPAFARESERRAILQTLENVWQKSTVMVSRKATRGPSSIVNFYHACGCGAVLCSILYQAGMFVWMALQIRKH